MGQWLLAGRPVGHNPPCSTDVGVVALGRWRGEGWSLDLIFFPDVSPEVKSGQQYFREAINLVELGERYGYTHVRTVEHYFQPYGGYSPNPVVFLAAAADLHPMLKSSVTKSMSYKEWQFL